MNDMIPASKVAAAALRQIEKATERMPSNRYEDGQIEAQKIHLGVAAELLALIAEPPVVSKFLESEEYKNRARVGDDEFYSLPLPEGWKRLGGHHLIVPDSLSPDQVSGRLVQLARSVVTDAGEILKSVNGSILSHPDEINF